MKRGIHGHPAELSLGNPDEFNPCLSRNQVDFKLRLRNDLVESQEKLWKAGIKQGWFLCCLLRTS